MKLTLGRIADLIHAEGDFTTNVEATGYSIDSRTIAAGDLFFAVKGDRVDGHDYVEAALANGAVAAVVSMRWLAPDEMDACKLLRVPDDEEDCVLQSMQKLAHAVRRMWGKRVIGVTGSAGKTTTKEAVAQVLGARFKVLKSGGNFNNAFGMPLEMLKLEPEHEVAVLEMGMNHAGEIRALAKIAEPDWAVVSNVAPVHLEHFADGIAGIARAKQELVDALPAEGIAILNADDAWVSGFARGFSGRSVLYGLGVEATVRGTDVREDGIEGTHFVVEVAGERAEVRLQLMGQHNVYNVLAGIAVGLESGMKLAECARAIEGLRPSDKRGEVMVWHGATVINDCYNSNPRALEAMVKALGSVPAKRRIVVAGEMLELGPEGAALHAASGAQMAEHGVDVVVGVRGLAKSLVEAARSAGVEAVFVPTPEEAGAWMVENLREGDAVLVKGSRGVGLERGLRLLKP